MKILVTGSAGFIGSALKDLLEEVGIETVSYDIRDNPKDDVKDFDRLRSKIKNIGGVIHLAAVSRVKVAQENPLECVQTNIGGTINILDAARKEIANGKHPWIIFGSSREVYGEPKILPVTENSPRNAINIYGISKVTGEDLCKMYSEHYKLKTRVLRFSNVYTGLKDQLDRVIPKFILQALKDEDLVINGTGEELFDFTYINDTVQGIHACVQEVLKSDISFEHFNISSGIPVTLRELAELIIKKTESNSHIKFTKSRSYDVNKFYADPTKSKKSLGIFPKILIDGGIELAIKELKKIK
ncbi:MAG: NAD-dependent epimerase/dehydratase family protein [Promethearchaeia archaeon]